MGVAKKTISLPDEMYRAAVERAKKLKYGSFSEYVQYLVAKDLAERPPHAIIRQEDPPPHGTATTYLRAAEQPPKP